VGNYPNVRILAEALNQERNRINFMIHTRVKLAEKQADEYVIPLGAVNLVNVVTK